MIVNSTKLRNLRNKQNWTQQQLAIECNLSLRTIQRVEKDGVASSDTVSAYCAVFEICHSEIVLRNGQLSKKDTIKPEIKPYFWLASGFLCGSLATAALLFLLGN